ncbi:MAG TPA: hypothetical protein VMA36_06010, partial [Candidatus Limnocylindria bacterium]|nr:hypothetical protein [Candidatus Limnocylindria bacterium]
MSVRSSGVVVYAGESSPSPVPPEFVDALDRVVVRQAHDRAATFQLVVNADRPVGAAAELPVISAGTVKPGTRVKIGIRLDATLCGVLDGIVSFQELTYAGKGGALTYSVIGEDLSLAMRLEEKATEWPGRSSAQIAREIIANYSRYGLSAKVVDPQQDVTPTVDQWIPQQNATDLAYLRALGRSFGHIFAIRPAASLDASSVAYWGPPAREGTPLPVLTVAAGPAGNVRSIEFGYDAA